MAHQVAPSKVKLQRQRKLQDNPSWIDMMPLMTLPASSSTKFIPQSMPESGSCFSFLRGFFKFRVQESDMELAFLATADYCVRTSSASSRQKWCESSSSVPDISKSVTIRWWKTSWWRLSSLRKTLCEVKISLFHFYQSKWSGTEEHWDGKHHTQCHSFHFKTAKKTPEKTTLCIGWEHYFLSTSLGTCLSFSYVESGFGNTFKGLVKSYPKKSN